MTDACPPPGHAEAPRRRRLFRPGVALLALLYLSLALANILRLPPLRGPDECDHLAYVQVLRSQHALPLLPRYAASDDPRVAEQAQHPPLYYALLAAASYALPDLSTPTGQRALKLVSVLLGLVGLLAFAACARELWPDDDVTALGAVGFVALMPNYWVLASHLNNTAGSLAASGVALLLLRRALATEEPQAGRWLAVGVTAALGMLAKITAAWLVPVMVVALWLQARRQGGWRTLLRSALPALAPMVLLVGAWLAYNWFNFGEVMPERVLDREYVPSAFVLLFQPFAALLLLHVVAVKIPLTAFAPYWLMADALGAGVGMIVLALFLAPPLLAATRGAWQLRGKPATASPRQALLAAGAVGVLAAWFIATEAVMHDWNTGLYAGRYAVDALPAVALLGAAGMRKLLPHPRARAAGVGLWLLGLLVLSLLVHHYMVAFFMSH